MLVIEVFIASMVGGVATTFAAVSKAEEVVTVRSGSDITRDEWYCPRHNRWNAVDDECNCCAMWEDWYEGPQHYDYTEFNIGSMYVHISGSDRNGDDNDDD